MAEFFEQKQNEMVQLTKEHFNELMSIWVKIFDAEECDGNVCRLVYHANKFYKDLIKESLESEEKFKEKIAQLQEEAEELRRLLKIDFQLPNVDNGNDLPLKTIHIEMNKSLAELRNTLRMRREQICELLLQQEELCEELGEQPRPLLADPLPTGREISDFEQYLNELRTLRVDRLNKLSCLRREIKEYLQILDLSINTDTEYRLLHDVQIKLNAETFNRLCQMHANFAEQVKQLHSLIEDMQKKLENLWQRLEVPQEKRDKFRQYVDYNQKTYDILYQELQRCEQLKRQNIKRFVEQLRTELQQWWDKTLKSDIERQRFTHFNNNCYTDDLLVLHEMELDELKQHYETNYKIYELYEERQLLWERMTAMETKGHDPSRYNNRGGQLLREEKERKIIANKLPKIEQKITDFVRIYEEEKQSPFTIYGENILELMAKQWEEKRHEKEQLTSARKKKTPVPESTASVSRTPLSLKNSSTMGRSMMTIRGTRLTPAHAPITRNAMSTQKRKLYDTDKLEPRAKRSLKRILDSPSLQSHVPSSTATNATTKSARSIIMGTNKLHREQFKSPMKKKVPRVMASTIKRRSNARLSGTKKRLSRGDIKQCVSAKTIPKIKVNDHSDGYTDTEDDAYHSFQKRIEVRSSMVLPTAANAAAGNKFNQKRHILTPSKHSMREYTASTTNHPVPRILPQSPSINRSKQQLSTKNLPIII